MGTNQWDIVQAEYAASAVSATQHPERILEEVAFIGRSNVGKSSLLNSLTRRKNLARVSSSPGKTQTINFYECTLKRTLEDGPEWRDIYAVDLPGYGFARTSKSNKENWSAFIAKYLENATRLKVVCQLVDIRHAPMESDIACYQWLQNLERPTLVILTKSDKISKNAIEPQRQLFKKVLGMDDNHIMTYTSTQHTMRNELIARITQYLE